jgi:integrative and conjugative element protein (TIGR02256 family)
VPLWRFARTENSGDRSRVLVHHPIGQQLDAASRTCRGRGETGGILLGRVRGPHLEVLSSTAQGPTDVSGQFLYVRQDPLHQAAAETAWTRSGGTETFIGEWHTHPSGGPVPSSIDRTGWAKLVRQLKHPMVFLVVAPDSWAAYLGKPGVLCVSITALEKIEHGLLGDVYGPMK